MSRRWWKLSAAYLLLTVGNVVITYFLPDGVTYMGKIETMLFAFAITWCTEESK